MSTPGTVRAYLAALHRLTQGQRLAHALLSGAFLGVMDRTALAALDTAFYARRVPGTAGKTVDYTDPDHMRSGLEPWERAALEAHFRPGSRLTITGAGAGRELWGALELGLRPDAYEPHAGLRAAGNGLLEREGRAERIGACGRDAFPAGVDETDGVLVGWGSYSHIAPQERRVAFLGAARATLRAGAPLMVSFWMLPGQTRYLRAVWLTARLVRRVAGGAAPEYGDLLSPTFFHAFTEAELRTELALAGFECVAYSVTPYPHAVALAA